MTVNDTTAQAGAPASAAAQVQPTLPFILASASPARLRTLRAAGIETEAIVSGVDESQVDDPRPAALCATLARLKADAVVERLAAGADSGSGSGGATRLVLGCDSVLAFDGEILGKPADAAEAVRRWRSMRGRHGILYTGHCLIETGTGRRCEEVGSTTVHFADVTDAEIDAYVSTGEPLHVAGAFTIDGLGGAFVERIEGDPGTVIGVSLPLLRRLLNSLDVPIWTVWGTSPHSP